MHETIALNDEEGRILDSLAPLFDNVPYATIIEEVKAIYENDMRREEPGWNFFDFDTLKLTARDIGDWKRRAAFVTVNGKPNQHKKPPPDGWSAVQRERLKASAKELGLRCLDTAVWQVTKIGLRRRIVEAPQRAAAPRGSAAAGVATAGAAPVPAGAGAASTAAVVDPARAPAAKRDRDLSPPRSPRELPSPVSAAAPPPERASQLRRTEAAPQLPPPPCPLCRAQPARCDNGACGFSHCALLQKNRFFMPCSAHRGATPNPPLPPPPPPPPPAHAAKA